MFGSAHVQLVTVRFNALHGYLIRAINSTLHRLDHHSRFCSSIREKTKLFLDYDSIIKVNFLILVCSNSLPFWEKLAPTQ